MENYKRKIQVISLSLGLLITSAYTQTKAFPYAEGFGAFALGGRGGRVIAVTNLNENGGGSLRAACEAQGPRTIIFKIGGTLRLTEDIYIRNPYITIAGQTAPGDGILIRGGAIRPSTHDVIIRGLRFRIGSDPNGPTLNNRDGIGVENPGSQPYNIIIDHCSIAWATDENFVTWYESRDLTIQWCIISEALRSSDGEAGYGARLGYAVNRISVLHNLFAHNRSRNPLAQGGPSRFEIVNNLIYNWGIQPIGIESEINGTSNANVIGNFMVPGPSTTFSWIKKGVGLQKDGPTKLHPDSRVYVEGNLGPGRKSDDLDEWAIVDGSESFRSLEPIMEISDCSIYETSDVFEIILNNAGARVPYLDDVDQEVIEDVRNGTGSLLERSTVLQWSVLNTGNNPSDSDNDGMPDSWETANNLNSNDSADGNLDRNGDGYTNLEEYLNGLFPQINAKIPKRVKNIRIAK